MTVLTSQITVNRPYGSNGQNKIREEYTDQDSNPLPQHTYIAEAGYDVDAALIANVAALNEQLAQQEIDRAVAECYAGNDPLNTTPFNPITPIEQTWDELMFGVSIFFLSKDDQLELQYWAESNGNISSGDKRRVWDMSQPEVSGVNADVQVAVDTQATLDTYIKSFNEDGSKT